MLDLLYTETPFAEPVIIALEYSWKPLAVLFPTSAFNLPEIIPLFSILSIVASVKLLTKLLEYAADEIPFPVTDALIVVWVAPLPVVASTFPEIIPEFLTLFIYEPFTLFSE